MFIPRFTMELRRCQDNHGMVGIYAPIATGTSSSSDIYTNNFKLRPCVTNG